MNQNEVKHILDTMGVALRCNRERAATLILHDLTGIQEVLPLVFDTQYKNHHKAAWVIEIIFEQDLSLIYPHLTYFTSHLHHVKNDSAVRSLAKICRWVALDYKKCKTLQHPLQIAEILQLVEAGFDWMIGPYPVAPKAYTMDTLFIFGNVQNAGLEWVLESLKDVILQQIQQGSPGFQNHGHKILEQLKRIK
ncbi:MAG: hypothetical protein IT220_02535 [Flavobacteriaceae bacterium]|nr:hypothetical protein [Flavobacteriaceae bacterium]